MFGKISKVCLFSPAFTVNFFNKFGSGSFRSFALIFSKWLGSSLDEKLYKFNGKLLQTLYCGQDYLFDGMVIIAMKIGNVYDLLLFIIENLIQFQN